ncbi:MAG TPA: rhombosortase [Fontimonas sp.]
MLILALETLGDGGRSALAYDRTQILHNAQWWRVLTGSLVHLGWYHCILNALGLVVLVLLCPDAMSGWVWARRVGVLAVVMSFCLLAFEPGLRNYVGMSGVIHGLFVLGLMPQVLKRDLIAAGCLIYLVGKIGWELVAGGPVSDEAALGGRVVVESHLFGTLAAFGYGLVFGSFRGKERSSMIADDKAKTGQDAI